MNIESGNETDRVAPIQAPDNDVHSPEFQSHLDTAFRIGGKARKLAEDR